MVWSDPHGCKVDRTIVLVYNSRDFQPRACIIIRSGEKVLRVGIQELAGRCEDEFSVVAVFSGGWPYTESRRYPA